MKFRRIKPGLYVARLPEFGCARIERSAFWSWRWWWGVYAIGKDVGGWEMSLALAKKAAAAAWEG